MTKYLHTMIRVADPEATVAFFRLIGLEETRRFDSEQGRFTLIFLAAPGQEGQGVQRVAAVVARPHEPHDDAPGHPPLAAAELPAHRQRERRGGPVHQTTGEAPLDGEERLLGRADVLGAEGLDHTAILPRPDAPCRSTGIESFQDAARRIVPKRILA